jgi:subtilisin-like proprotein convertase family protein
VYTDSDGDRAVSDHAKVEEFNAFAAGYTWGVTVAAGPIDGGGGAGAEVFVARDKGLGLVRVFSDTNADGRVGNDPLFSSFNVYNTWQGGVRVASGDTDASGVFHEVVVGPGPGGGTLGIWDNPAATGAYTASQASPAYGAAYKGGFFVAFGQVRSGGFFSSAPVPLPDLSTTTSSIVVPAGAGRITDLNVSLGITHTYNSDLTVTLRHVPTGTTLTLFSNVGGSGDGFSITLDDSAGTDIGTATGTNGQMLFGTFNPEGAVFLSAFNGLDASGEWILTVTDGSGEDSGTLNSWGLHITF